MTTPENIDAPGGVEKKPPLILTLGVVAALSAVAAGGGWLMGGGVAPQQSDVAAEAAAKEGASVGEAPPEPADLAVVDLEPITTNLAYPAENWVRLEVALVFAAGAEPDETLVRAIQEDILAYLRTVSLQQIAGARGFQHLRRDLTERAALRSDGAVTDLLFSTFVIE